MSLNAATIALLLSKGFSGEDLLEVAEAMEKKADLTAAARMRKMRAKNKRISEDVTPVTVTDEPLNDNILNPISPVVSDETTQEPPEPVLRVEHVVEAWNDLTARCRSLKAVQRVTPERRKKITTRISQNTADDFTEAISAIERSPFLRGESDRGWRATFDWMLEPKNFTKLVEGNYDR